MIKILKFQSEIDAQLAEKKICDNCLLPNGQGTDKWSKVYYHPDGFYYINLTLGDGWNGFTQEQMLDGIVDYEISKIPKIIEPDPS